MVGGKNTMNTKYEITDIAHEKYPFLHRIRALRDIGSEVKAGDLGGFVEGESNLSFETGDNAWIFDDAIAAGEGCVDKGSVLRERAIVVEAPGTYSRGSALRYPFETVPVPYTSPDAPAASLRPVNGFFSLVWVSLWLCQQCERRCVP